MQFIGAIAFLDSAERTDRVTNVMQFEVMTDWFTSVRDYFQEEVRTGFYDGSEILVTVYQFEGNRPVTDFDYDSERVIDSLSIMNPYYV